MYDPKIPVRKHLILGEWHSTRPKLYTLTHTLTHTVIHTKSDLRLTLLPLWMLDVHILILCSRWKSHPICDSLSTKCWSVAAGICAPLITRALVKPVGWEGLGCSSFILKLFGGVEARALCKGTVDVGMRCRALCRHTMSSWSLFCAQAHCQAGSLYPSDKKKS